MPFQLQNLTRRRCVLSRQSMLCALLRKHYLRKAQPHLPSYTATQSEVHFKHEEHSFL